MSFCGLQNNYSGFLWGPEEFFPIPEELFWNPEQRFWVLEELV